MVDSEHFNNNNNMNMNINSNSNVNTNAIGNEGFRLNNIYNEEKNQFLNGKTTSKINYKLIH
jgi:hypothetical protein